MNKAGQTAKYVTADILSASLAWLLFNVVRYEEVAVYKGFEGFMSFLSHRPVWESHLLIPVFWLILYFFSGYYNKPFAKSRLNELFSTFITSLAGALIIFFCTCTENTSALCLYLLSIVFYTVRVAVCLYLHTPHCHYTTDIEKNIKP